MKQFKRKIESIYGEDEQRVLIPSQRIRQFFLAPVARLLSHLGITPDMLSFASVAFGIGFCLLAPFQFTTAFWLLVCSVICDGLDGVEARLKGASTPRGSFTDVCCDAAVVAFSVAGMAWKGSIYPALAILFVYVYTTLVMFLMLHQMLQVSSRWIIRPSRMVLYIAIGVYFFFHIDVLNALLFVYLLALPILVVSFWRLRNTL
ncbi:MAG TPA: CDP-alcohol phosphatidyltransferase family protein [Ktedonobacteraceae bacterium]|jgi:phosphatidylglycerophosphate synthase|nr:CDP-alcohol phosphatidyltransferase family protein [Ktedonobacteraceae bacterium]